MSDVPTWIYAIEGGLLVLSGSFSASETALFSLGPREREESSSAVRRLLAQPRELLATVLLGNLVVNVLFFAFASRLMPEGEGSTDFLVGLGALIAVLVFGEILPKTAGLRAAIPLSRWAAPALLVFSRLVAPLRRPLIWLLDLSCRLLGNWAQDEHRLEPDDLAQVLERTGEAGHLFGEEADLLVQIVELDGIRVREIMVPRVDVLFYDLQDPAPAACLEEAIRKHRSSLPVIDGNPDRVTGLVRLRDLLTHPDRPPQQMVMPVPFVPEVASCLDLLHQMRTERFQMAVVVDEWGGTAGLVTIEDVFEELLGEMRVEGEARRAPVVPLGEGIFRVDGALSIRDWTDHFGYRVVPTEFETVGGFVTALLRRIPRAGDEVRYGPLAFEVHEVRGRRILTVDMRVVEGAVTELAREGGPERERSGA